jgi:transposase
MQVSTIGVDLAKNVFQVHGVDSAGKVVITRQLRRKQVIDFFSKIPACLVGMEACGTAHHWAREVSKLGHIVRLMPPSYVKGYVKRSKNDAADAAAICEAVTRPSMRFVPIKSADQQALLMLHRTRDLLIRQRTQLINALRSHLAEFGLVAATGREGLAQLAAIITDESNREALPSAMKQALQAIVDQLAALELQIGTLDRAIHAHHRANDMSCRLETVPGIGVIGATAIASTVTDPNDFKSGRDFAAWIGLVPRQHSTGARSDSAVSPSREIAIFDGCLSSVQQRLFDTPGSIRKSIPGSSGCWLRSRPSSSPLPLPTRWRASLGRSWPREDTTERRSLLQPPKEAWQWEREATAERDNRIARVMMA